MPDMGLDGRGERRRLGVLVIGLGGAVATTAVAGIEMLRAGGNDTSGLPLADITARGLAPYADLHFGGWDVNGADLATALAEHRVVAPEQSDAIVDRLRAITPWQAVGSRDFCRNIDGANKFVTTGHRDAVARIRDDIRGYRERTGIDDVVVINLASVERWPDDVSSLADTGSFEKGLDRDDECISPAMLYAYAAISEGVPYGNFTPSLAADIPALTALAAERGVPIAGKDGKTGQTFIKTVLAPAFRARALHVEGWFSTNILGNRDGFALNDAGSLASKVQTKGSVLDQILGYKVEDHLVDIRYYRPRGDNKEAWDNIDLVGFLGQKMQIKVNFLCRDSILAAPLVVEIARVLDLARQRGSGGVQEQLGLFFKAPMTRSGPPEHGFAAQQAHLLEWLAAG